MSELCLTPLTALSPLDGRYGTRTQSLSGLLSEAGFMAHRVEVEVAWLLGLMDAGLAQLPDVSEAARARLHTLVANFSSADARRIKVIEQTTNHDMKAVEYWLKERLAGDDALAELAPVAEFIHFACTSEDINNTAHALMLTRTRERVLLPMLGTLHQRLVALAHAHSGQAMLARTHGQAASPTTVGKEFANVAARLARAIAAIRAVQPLAKLNGATGNYNAHLAAYPEVDWPRVSASVLAQLGLAQNPHTIQIEPHDWMAELFDAIARANTVLLDLNRDLWGYIALGYFRQKLKAGEVGSSTMPHKVNPIDFENSEGNIGLANALLRHMSEKLPISRWQRDLSDSTVLRNLGVAFGYCLVAWESCIKGLDKLQVNAAVIDADVDAAWEVLAEPIQTVMRRYGLPEPYEQLKALTRGQGVSQQTLHTFIAQLDLPEAVKSRLLALTPRRYTGLAAELARQV